MPNSRDPGFHIGTINRKEVGNNEDDLVAIVPTRKTGIDFLKENQAWGFIRMKREPKYTVFYISGDINEVRYIARVKEIVPADEAPLSEPVERYENYDRSKKVIVFEDDSVYELKDPIPYRNQVPYSLRYTTLNQFRSATSTDDLF